MAQFELVHFVQVLGPERYLAAFRALVVMDPAIVIGPFGPSSKKTSSVSIIPASQ